jgi:uncharacterized protein Smg (DUF494 family)
MNRVNPFFKAERDSYSLTVAEYSHFELEYYIFKSSKAPIICIWDKKIGKYNSMGLIYYMNETPDIKEDVLEIIEEVMERNWGDEILGNNYTLVSVMVDPEMSYITTNNDLDAGKKEAILDELMQLKTEDFKTITLKWLDFLKSQDS